MAANRFKARELEDFTIENDGKVIGHIRVKPSGILWAPRDSKKWYRISLEDFAAFAEENGTRQDK